MDKGSNEAKRLICIQLFYYIDILWRVKKEIWSLLFRNGVMCIGANTMKTF